jgi:hypothetical protein
MPRCSPPLANSTLVGGRRTLAAVNVQVRRSAHGGTLSADGLGRVTHLRATAG